MTEEEILNRVGTAVDVIVSAAAQYGGLFPSLLNPESGEMLMELPPEIPGQRRGDRAYLGSNLMHDHTTLKAMMGLNRESDVQAAERYLDRFTEHCTGTSTGLFPWGEHAYWHLEEDRVGDSHRLANPTKPVWTALHDHLRQAPVWLWEQIYQCSPGAVEFFAEGLDYHYKEGDRREYIRHAHIEKLERLPLGPKSADFPRHGGFYILDWSYAAQQSDRGDFWELIEEMVDYWWPHRDEDGLLMIHTRCPEEVAEQYQVNAVGQTLSLGISLLESADLVEELQPGLAATMRERAHVYLEGFLSAPHDLENAAFVNASRRGTRERVHEAAVWGSVYGQWPVSYIGLMAMCAFRFSQDERFLDWGKAAGRAYLDTPFPSGVNVPAMDAGMGIELVADLYSVTSDSRWMEEGVGLAEGLIGIYWKGDLLAGASEIDWYESQMGPGDMLHGLTRLALLGRDGPDCGMTPNYTGR